MQQCEWQPYSRPGETTPLGCGVTLVKDQETGDVIVTAKAQGGKMSQEQKDAIVVYFSGQGVDRLRTHC